jgi:hypothetical protein
VFVLVSAGVFAETIQAGIRGNMEDIMVTDWIQAICAIIATFCAVKGVIIGVKSLPKISKKIEDISNDVLYEKNITNPQGCIYLELGNVDPEKGHRIRHAYCQHPDRRAINKVPSDKKLFCMGSRCGCAIFQ